MYGERARKNSVKEDPVNKKDYGEVRFAVRTNKTTAVVVLDKKILKVDLESGK